MRKLHIKVTLNYIASEKKYEVTKRCCREIVMVVLK
jgi:hypothetical protein